MAPFLSEEWLEALVRHAELLPEVPGATMTLQHVVSGAPGGKVHVVVDVVDGRVVSARPGRHKPGDDPKGTCTVSWTFEDAWAALRGELDLDAAYMQGRVKLDGDYAGVLVGLRPALQSEGGHRYREVLAADTDPLDG